MGVRHRITGGLGMGDFHHRVSGGLGIFDILDIDITPPETPTGLGGVSIGPVQIDLSWNASIDPAPDPSGIRGYHIYRNGGRITTQPVTSTSVSVFNLNPETTYNFQVSAIDNSSNESPLSDEIQVTTPRVPVAEVIQGQLAASVYTNDDYGKRQPDVRERKMPTLI